MMPTNLFFLILFVAPLSSVTGVSVGGVLSVGDVGSTGSAVLQPTTTTKKKSSKERIDIVKWLGSKIASSFIQWYLFKGLKQGQL